MNTHLKAVKMLLKGKESSEPGNAHSARHNIRYVILPDSLNIGTHLVDDGPKVKAKPKETSEALFPALILSCIHASQQFLDEGPTEAAGEAVKRCSVRRRRRVFLPELL